MAGILDILAPTEAVTIRGTAVEVRGLAFTDLVGILRRFPAAASLLTGGEGVEVGDLLAAGPAIVGAVLAAACGHAGDAAVEEHCARLDLEAQAALLEPVLRLTFPGGLAPFAERLAAMGAALGVAPAGAQ